jgi:hypothetical protein
VFFVSLATISFYFPRSRGGAGENSAGRARAPAGGDLHHQGNHLVVDLPAR